jgi:hypothetical protein
VLNIAWYLLETMTFIHSPTFLHTFH